MLFCWSENHAATVVLDQYKTYRQQMVFWWSKPTCLICRF